MLVDQVETCQEFVETLPANHRHDRKSDGRIDGVSTADPIPEAEHVRGVDTELFDQGGIGGDRDEVLAHRGVAEFRDQPTSGRSGVGQGLQGREGFRCDDEKRCGRVQPGEFSGQIRGVDIGDEPCRDPGIGVVAQRRIDHRRTQV